MAKNLVELHGGTITADSQDPDMGSEFVVRLPVIVRASPKECNHHRWFNSISPRPYPVGGS